MQSLGLLLSPTVKNQMLQEHETMFDSESHRLGDLFKDIKLHAYMEMSFESNDEQNIIYTSLFKKWHLIGRSYHNSGEFQRS